MGVVIFIVTTIANENVSEVTQTEMFTDETMDEVLSSKDTGFQPPLIFPLKLEWQATKSN